jgi:hypothetical protein
VEPFSPDEFTIVISAPEFAGLLKGSTGESQKMKEKNGKRKAEKSSRLIHFSSSVES